jgi:hypothetical protein
MQGLYAVGHPAELAADLHRAHLSRHVAPNLDRQNLRAADKELASVIIRLMMAVNDIVMASDGLGEWTSHPKRTDRQQSAKLY